MYNTLENGYNLTKGGDSNPMENEKILEQHNKKMRSKEVRDKISNTMKKKVKEGILFSKEHRKHLSDVAMGNHNFGTGDTRSIGCYCILSDGTRIEFHSILDGGKWWYENYSPFGKTYSISTYQRKIENSMNGKEIVYGNKTHKNYKIISNIKWYKIEREVMQDEVNKNKS